jgi:hypothetical protein
MSGLQHKKIKYMLLIIQIITKLIKNTIYNVRHTQDVIFTQDQVKYLRTLLEIPIKKPF